MLNQNAHLRADLFDATVQKPTRDGFGDALMELGEKDERVVVVCADLADSTRTLAFKNKYPARYIEAGVAEQNMATVSSGLANYGKIPFMASYAAFSPGRNNEQIRTTIALNEVPVKVMGMHAGVSVGPDGATHQALEDMALMRIIPNMVVVSPCDAIEARKAVLAVAQNDKPSYVRFAREKTPVMTVDETQ
ncbi:MAG TPA: transketolase family protein, partial [Candidatus Paceibacterota bacterium]